MDESSKRLERFLSKDTRFADFNLRQISSGDNRDSYTLEPKGEKYVAKISKANNDGGSSLGSEALFLSFFEFAGIDFTPRLILFSQADSISIETYVGDRLLFDKLTSKQIELFARQLASIHNLSISSLAEFCKNNNWTMPKPNYPMDNLETFGIKRLDRARTTCPDKAVIEWIVPRLEANISKAKKISNSTNLQIAWGDIGNNICSGPTGQGIFFIDWEFATLSCPTSEMAYIKIHSHPSPSMLARIVRTYSSHRGTPEHVIWDEIQREEEIIRLNDVIWSAMKWGESVKTSDSEIFKNQTFERIARFEKLTAV